MKKSHKKTAWKKNRKLGDIYGGRTKLKCKDNIFQKFHNFLPPTPDQEIPIFLIENTSKDFYFPVNIDDIKQVIGKLPQEHTKYMTHIWLDNVKKQHYLRKKTCEGEFICGKDVYIIKLYAVPRDNKMFFGKNKPTKKDLSFYKNYCNNLQHDKHGWYLQWTNENYKKYFLERLLLHEIGHCVDYIYKHIWSKANIKQVEDFADDYAMTWGKVIKFNFEE